MEIIEVRNANVTEINNMRSFGLQPKCYSKCEGKLFFFLVWLPRAGGGGGAHCMEWITLSYWKVQAVEENHHQ